MDLDKALIEYFRSLTPEEKMKLVPRIGELGQKLRQGVLTREREKDEHGRPHSPDNRPS